MQPEINELERLNEPMEPDVYIVDRILPQGVTFLCGNPKIGKSWLALKLCMCATRGVDLWGYKTLHCKALYCCLEDTKKRIHKRYDDLWAVAEELQGTIPTGWLNFRFQYSRLDQDELEAYIKNNPECKLIVIDTITLPMNDARFENDYIVALRKLSEKYKIAIVLICRMQKQKTKNPFEEIIMMILSREGSKGTLTIVGRDNGYEEIYLEFHDGDWQKRRKTYYNYVLYRQK